MPEIAAIIPVIISGLAAAGPAIGAATGLATLGLDLANQPGAPKPQALPAETPAQAVQARQNQEASVSNQFPNLQAQTGGTLSPDAYITLTTLLSGQGGTPGIGSAQQDLLQKLTGNQGAPFTVSAGIGGGGTTGSTGGLVSG